MSTTPCWKCDFPILGCETSCPKCKATTGFGIASDPAGDSEPLSTAKWVPCQRCQYMNPPNRSNCISCQGAVSGYSRLVDHPLNVPDMCPDKNSLEAHYWIAHRDTSRRDHGRN